MSILKEGYTLPFRERPALSRLPLIVSKYVNPLKNKSLSEALSSLIQKQAVERVVVKSSLAFYNRLFLVPKPNRKWRPILDLSKLNLFLETGTFKMETPETIRLSLQSREWVTSQDFSDAYFHIPQRSRKVSSKQTHLQVHLSRLWFGNGPVGIHQSGQGSKTDGSSQGYQDPPVPRRLVVESPVPGNLPTTFPDLLDLCHELGWVVNLKKSELTPQQDFNFVGYRFDLLTGRVLPTQDRWTTLQQNLHFIEDRNCGTVRQFTFLIGLLTATEKQIWSGRLHMQPIQWHVKCHWHVPESLEKVIPLPPSLHPDLDWWLNESNVLWGQPLHPLQHALQIFTDTSNKGWGAHLRDSTARGVWSDPESHLHINFLELKAVFLALKSFEYLCRDQIVLIATDNTTVVSDINKEGGMRSGSLCALLWRLLSWCHPRGIGLRARHIPGRLNVIADKLSRHNQVIQIEWSLSQQGFNLLCSRWARPHVDLFATRFNHKLVPDPTDWAVDALSLP